ncbi:MAG: histidinol phosphatase [Sphingobacteriales bacterium]|nr:histidinol phosphatase [Sphingobacteriales bacterium]
MFNLFKKNVDVSAMLSLLKTDMHSHLIPGIDDGSPDMDTSMALISGLQQLGYKKFITSPHIMWDMYKNERDTILRKADEVREELRRRNINVEFHAAAEYFMDDYFSKLIKSGAPLLTIKDNWVLVEFSFISQPFDLKQNLFDLQIKGYKPVIAHPERYSYFHSKKERVHELYEQGCLLQVNLLSLSGYYGKPVQEMAKYLLKNNLVTLFGTDLHHFRHLESLHDKEIFRIVKEEVESGNIVNAEL